MIDTGFWTPHLAPFAVKKHRYAVRNRNMTVKSQVIS
jgi:hypothetical protein